MKEKSPQTSCQQPYRGISVITPLPAGEGLGEGPAPHGFETVRKKALLTLWAL